MVGCLWIAQSEEKLWGESARAAMHKGYPKGYPLFQWKDEVWLMSCGVIPQKENLL
jgi:hypothetical protein